MQYTKSLALKPTEPLAQPLQPELVCPRCQNQFHLTPPPPRKPKPKHLWVDAVQVIEPTQALSLAQKAVAWGEGPRLSAKAGPRRGAPRIYEDSSLLLTFLIAKLWHLSYAEMLAWLANWPHLA